MKTTTTARNNNNNNKVQGQLAGERWFAQSPAPPRSSDYEPRARISRLTFRVDTSADRASCVLRGVQSLLSKIKVMTKCLCLESPTILGKEASLWHLTSRNHKHDNTNNNEQRQQHKTTYPRSSTPLELATTLHVCLASSASKAPPRKFLEASEWEK